FGAAVFGNMGSSLFSATLTPNSTWSDLISGRCPDINGDKTYKAPCASNGNNYVNLVGQQAAARSKHESGLNAAMADGSVRFFDNSVKLAAWRAMGTIRGEDTVNISP